MLDTTRFKNFSLYVTHFIKIYIHISHAANATCQLLPISFTHDHWMIDLNTKVDNNISQIWYYYINFIHEIFGLIYHCVIEKAQIAIMLFIAIWNWLHHMLEYQHYFDAASDARWA